MNFHVPELPPLPEVLTYAEWEEAMQLCKEMSAIFDQIIEADAVASRPVPRGNSGRKTAQPQPERQKRKCAPSTPDKQSDEEVAPVKRAKGKAREARRPSLSSVQETGGATMAPHEREVAVGLVKQCRLFVEEKKTFSQWVEAIVSKEDIDQVIPEISTDAATREIADILLEMSTSMECD